MRQKAVRIAQELFEDADSVEVDDNAQIIGLEMDGDPPGLWIQAKVWVPAVFLREEGDGKKADG